MSQQDAINTVVKNYGLYHDIADELEKLQEFVRDQLK